MRLGRFALLLSLVRIFTGPVGAMVVIIIELIRGR